MTRRQEMLAYGGWEKCDRYTMPAFRRTFKGEDQIIIPNLNRSLWRLCTGPAGQSFGLNDRFSHRSIVKVLAEAEKG
jgi:hypothetical protein